MESKTMQDYHAYMCDNQNLKVGVYEAYKLANICHLSIRTLLFLGARANATQAPIAIKEGWYIYTMEERMKGKHKVHYITIDNIIKYI